MQLRYCGYGLALGISPLETKAVTVSLLAGTTVGGDGLGDILSISSLHACAFNKLIFQNLKGKGKLPFVTQRVSRKHSIGQKQFYIATNLRLPFSFCLAEAGSGQDYVTSENQLLYYPSITYAIIGSSVIFVLVVAFLALVLHHQRKRNNLMTLPVHRLQHPVLLSRLVVLDHPHHCSVTYNVNNGIQYMASQPYHRPVELDSPPSYSEAVLDQSRPPWFDLPPPPYCSESESPNQPDLPPYRSRSGSLASTDTPVAESPVGTSNSWMRDVQGSLDGHRTLLERTVDQRDPLVSHTAEREV
ncbi:hypothetical protein DV515_00002374 [Chloebia gouldiae]|uniref:Low density lipoprotein receptor class A domain containing 3 n=1 Tax=Chloebia gouldiae TaxID=44316 RepID=A0A3L8SY86_CHLGU|nr:hypothetical protein DV515_00002374 [Chloebia gouldiae]